MGCMYCQEDDLRRSLMETLCELPFSTVMVMRDQKYYGRCVVAFRLHHADELYELTPEELAGFMTDVAAVARAVQKVSGAAKINYAIYGDLVSHVHVHVVPKRPGGPDWGGPFRMDGEKVFLPEEEWAALRAALSKELA